jgi:peptidoglycan/xylan/chitin deacetylase (PgdA/CDA1 family)
MIFLSFDIEEFDNPFPCTQDLSFDRQMEISAKGTETILSLLARHSVPATFFCTVNFAMHAKSLIARMASEGHEVASHGYYHNRFETAHLRQSHEALEKLTGKTITGFRMPNMGNVTPEDLTAAGYSYNSSLHPTFLPGKYNNFSKPRRIFREGALFQIPASVAPVVRLPLFWLALHNYPLSIYKYLANWTLKNDGYLVLYFHPWEFIDLHAFNLPFYVQRNSGNAMAQRLGSVIDYFKRKGIPFGRLSECVELYGATRNGSEVTSRFIKDI